MARRFQVDIDCEDPDRLANFWAEVLEYRLLDPPAGHASWAEYSRTVAEQPGEAWCRIADPDGRGPNLFFHRVPEPKRGKNRLHLDVHAPHDPPGDRRHQVDTEVARLVGLGAHKLRDVTDDAGYFVVMQDPEGNEFCMG